MTAVLVANRGEVAARVVRGAHAVGLEAVVVATDDPADAAHTRGADRVVPLPGSGPSAYLDPAALVEAAVSAGCGLLHPGWGFLSESAAFATAVAEAGVTFVGPGPHVLELFGDKAAARALARSTGVPVLPASGGGVTAGDAIAFARRVGRPVMVKAVAGGGGRGMRPVGEPAGLEAAMRVAAAEAAAAFGDGSLFVEQYVPRARHVEVQLLGDGSGTLIALGTRDCTLQRNHQKVVELAPAPTLGGNDLDRLIPWAVSLGAAAGVAGLCTVEFLVDVDDGGCWFIEANPRLQVEHGVTELVTGVDLVAAQLRVAQGARLVDLGLADGVLLRGSAAEARITIEEVGDGVLRGFDPPAGVRVDAAVRSGDVLGTAFDPLLAKVLVRRDDDDLAALLGDLSAAVRGLRVEGPTTNAPLVVSVLDRVLAGETATTVLIDDLVDATRPTQVDGMLLHAVVPGVVTEVSVHPGEAVDAGRSLLVVEAMKLQHDVVAPHRGRIDEVLVAVGDRVAAGDPVVSGRWEAPDPAAAATVADDAGTDEALETLRRRRSAMTDEERPEAVARRHERGRRTVRENLADLLDPRSFREYGALVVAAQRSRRDPEELERATPADGVVTGFGTVGATRFSSPAETAVVAYDGTVLAGTQGMLGHEKTERLFELAARRRTPVVVFAEGGGGRPGDVDDRTRASGMDLGTFVAFGRLNGLVPTVGIAAGRTFAGNAALLGACDLAIATEDASIGMGGPAMIEGGGFGAVDADAVGPAAMHAAAGSIDLLVADEAEAIDAAKRYLGYFRGTSATWAAADQDTLRRAVPSSRGRPFDVRSLIRTLADTGSFLELRERFGRAVVTALVRIEGRPIGLVANDCMHLGGAVDADASDKIARFLQLCDAFGVPLLTLVDTPGFAVGPEAEAQATVRHAGRLFVTAPNLQVPLCTVVIRRAYGLAGQIMGGGGFRVPDGIVGWPTATFGAMGPEGAVRLGYRKELAAIADAEERDRAFRRRVEEYEADGSAMHVASVFELDDVIDPAETRGWVLGTLTGRPATARERRRIDTW